MSETSAPTASEGSTRRRAAITGAASGIGAATAQLMIQAGWQVACLDRDIEGARRTAGDQLAIEVDVADEASVVRAFEQVGEAFGGLDALAACAGVIETAPFLETTPAMFRRLFDINVVGTFLSVREGARLMERGARVCLTASVAAYSGGGFVATGAYAASKGAVLPLMKSFARELGARGVAVNAIAPGFTNTPFVGAAMADPEKRQRIEAQVPRIGTAEEVAQAIVWLLSPEAAYVHGSTLIADGGQLMH